MDLAHLPNRASPNECDCSAVLAGGMQLNAHLGVKFFGGRQFGQFPRFKDIMGEGFLEESMQAEFHRGYSYGRVHMVRSADGNRVEVFGFVVKQASPVLINTHLAVRKTQGKFPETVEIDLGNAVQLHVPVCQMRDKVCPRHPVGSKTGQAHSVGRRRGNQMAHKSGGAQTGCTQMTQEIPT